MREKGGERGGRKREGNVEEKKNKERDDANKNERGRRGGMKEYCSGQTKIFAKRKRVEEPGVSRYF